jgi:hypothetical protein
MKSSLLCRDQEVGESRVERGSESRRAGEGAPEGARKFFIERGDRPPPCPIQPAAQKASADGAGDSRMRGEGIIIEGRDR